MESASLDMPRHGSSRTVMRPACPRPPSANVRRVRDSAYRPQVRCAAFDMLPIAWHRSPTALHATLLLLALPLALAAAYLLLLALCSWRSEPPVPARHTSASTSSSLPMTRRTVSRPRSAACSRSIIPGSLRRVLVIADNCSDATADRARAAGAIVLSATTPNGEGRGTPCPTPSPTSWRGPCRRGRGRRRRHRRVLQSPSGLRRPDWSMARSRPRATTSLGTRSPPGERGSWPSPWSASTRCAPSPESDSAFHRPSRQRYVSGHAILREVPYEAFSLVEDLGVRRPPRASRPSGALCGGRPGSVGHGFRGQAAASQRRRWEGGRLHLAWQVGPRLFLGPFPPGKGFCSTWRSTCSSPLSPTSAARPRWEPRWPRSPRWRPAGCSPPSGCTPPPWPPSSPTWAAAGGYRARAFAVWARSCGRAGATSHGSSALLLRRPNRHGREAWVRTARQESR